AKEAQAQADARKDAQRKADDELAQLKIDAIKDEFEKKRRQTQLDFDKFEKDKDEQLKQGLINQEQSDALVAQADSNRKQAIDEIDLDETKQTEEKKLKIRLDAIDKETTESITKKKEAFTEVGDLTLQAQDKLENEVANQELIGLRKRL